jgi:hypothetical protein
LKIVFKEQIRRIIEYVMTMNIVKFYFTE